MLLQDFEGFEKYSFGQNVGNSFRCHNRLTPNHRKNKRRVICRTDTEFHRKWNTYMYIYIYRYEYTAQKSKKS